ncbi:UvrD-helicase domain-containing protein [Candidatus Gracilibacteria bacterium]|nr:UvrD-helicase domain-containing protein [Candidatus Gracilibacteria bacterium]MCF7819371.1 UvrD-helicase domain-containing protein [Candidatus Gracilibacteria bacterium]
MSDPIFDGLNECQRKAVEILEGPLLILAGAGSGKTKCLTHRIANLIAHGVKGDRILAVTFTNKAANEMKTRVEKLLGFVSSRDTNPGNKLPTVGTFHSVCVRILRKDIEKLDYGITSSFVIFNTDDSRSLMKILMKERGYDEKEIKHKAVLAHISAAKNQLLTPEEYSSTIDPNKFTRAVSELFPEYQKRLAEHNALDFDDLLQKVVQLFESNEKVLEKYRHRWDHLLVDEYQDTNFAQYRLVRLLADKHQNLCVIGDDHQSIYSFRGADYTNILNFEKDFPNARVIKLEQNYRSTQNILNNANCLISFNQTGQKKELWTQNESGDPLRIFEVANEREEGSAIVDHIRELQEKENIRLSDCVILYRMNAQSRALEEAFMRQQIPYQIVGGTKFFDRREIKDVIAYLRLIFNPRDDVAFLRVINTPTRKIGPATIETVKKYSEHYTMSLFEVLENVKDMDELAENKQKVLADFRDMILHLRKLNRTEPVSIILDHLLDKIEYLKYLDDGTSEGEMRQENVRELFSVATKYDSADDSLASFLEGVALIADVDQYKESADQVTMMTMHTSKGLEFPIVFLPGWEDGIFPSANAQFSHEQVEEERRLGYVGITRAQKKCFITYARSRMLFGRTDYSSPSKFLSELHEDSVQQDSPVSAGSYMGRRKYDSGLEKEKQNILSHPPRNRQEAIFGVSDNETEFTVGTRLRHADFGEGTIIQISGDVLSVAFAGMGVKKIVASVAPIEVINS